MMIIKNTSALPPTLMGITSFVDWERYGLVVTVSPHDVTVQIVQFVSLIETKTLSSITLALPATEEPATPAQSEPALSLEPGDKIIVTTSVIDPPWIQENNRVLLEAEFAGDFHVMSPDGKNHHGPYRASDIIKGWELPDSVLYYGEDA